MVIDVRGLCAFVCAVAILSFSGFIYARGPIQTHIILHDKAAMSFSYPEHYFADLQVTLLKQGAFSITHPDKHKAPYISYIQDTTSITQAHARVNALEEKVSAFAEEFAAERKHQSEAMVLYMESLEIVKKEVYRLANDVVREQEQLKQILNGAVGTASPNFSLDELTPVASKITILEMRIALLQEKIEQSLANLPLIKTTSEGGDVAELALLLDRRDASVKSSGHIGCVLSQSVLLPHDQTIVIDRDTTIDGNGEAFSFANTDTPQLIVRNGCTLTLKNIRLKNIGMASIMMDEDAHIALGDKTIWELHDDVTFDRGGIVLCGDAALVRFLGIGTVRNVILKGARNEHRLDVQTATLLLEQVALIGGEQVIGTSSASRQACIIGAIGLGGNATIAAHGDITVGLMIYRRKNKIIFSRNRCSLVGPVRFAPINENAVSLLVNTENPCCFVGAQGVLVASDNGTARFVVKNQSIVLGLKTADAFSLGAHAEFAGNHVWLEGHSLRQVDSSSVCHVTSLQVSTVENSLAVAESDTLSYFTGVHRWLAVAQKSDQKQSAARDSEGVTILCSTQMQLSQAHGNITVQGGTLTSFGVSRDKPLTVTLAGNATVQQLDGTVTFKGGDVLRVRGANNRLVLSRAFNCYGTIICEAGSSLTIDIEDEGSLYIAPLKEYSFIIGDNAAVNIVGKGCAKISKHCAIDVGVNGRLVFKGGVEWSIVSQARCMVGGHGMFICEEASVGFIEPGGHLFIGMHPDDNMRIKCDTQATIVLGDLSDTDVDAKNASLSCAYGSYDLECVRGGSIYVGNNGECALNVRDRMPIGGVCSLVRLSSGGFIYLSKNGALLIGDNTGTNGSVLSWIECNGSLYGPGLISYVQTESTVSARSQRLSFSREPLQLHGTARSIVQSFVNMVKGLHNAMYFVNGFGHTVVVSVNGVIVQLKEGEIITHDDEVTGMIYGKGPEGSFVIKPNGQRL